MSLELCQKLFSELGNAIGIPDLMLDEEGYCGMSFDETDFHLQFDSENDELVIFTKLGELNEDAAEDGPANLLAANLFWQEARGATLAYEPSTRVVFIQDRKSVPSLDYPKFESWIETFVDTAEHWAQTITEWNDEPPTKPTEPIMEPGMMDRLTRMA